MASHAPQSLLLVTNNGSIMTNGYTNRLGKGQFGIVDKGVAPTALGNKVANTFPASPKDRLFQLVLGATDLTLGRTQSNKAWATVPFKLSEVVDISVSSPKIGVSVDDFIIGYDGVNDSSAIVLANGDNEVIDIKLCGEAIGFLGYANSEVTVKLYLEAPNEGAFTMHEIIEKAVERFKNIKLVGGAPITDYIDILPVNSENPVTVGGLNQQFYTLTVNDEGRKSDLGLVQAQYPLYSVRQVSHDGGKSTYVLIALEGAVIANYSQTTIAIADADCDGEPETTPTTVGTAWVAGDVCTAIAKNYTLQLADKCDDDRLEALEAAYPDLTILVDTATQVQTVDLTGTSGTANITVNGTDYLATFATDLATTEGNFVTAHAAAILAATGATITYAEGLITFTAPSTAFPTIVFDNLTGDLAGTIGALTGTGEAVTGVGCQTVYRTTVYSDLVCEECDPIFRDLFVAEAPARFELVDWVADAPIYDADAKMGIRVRGKVAIMSGSEEYRDEIPFIYSSTRVALSNEAPGFVNESYNQGTNGRFTVKILSHASEPEGLGKDMRDLEERTRVYFTNEQRHHGNNYAKWVLGEESLLKPLTPYITYSIRVRTVRFAQSFSGEVVENFNYMIAVEVGKQASLETLVNVLATATGLDTVAAY
jgi:hypothetical protein